MRGAVCFVIKRPRHWPRLVQQKRARSIDFAPLYLPLMLATLPLYCFPVVLPPDNGVYEGIPGDQRDSPHGARRQACLRTRSPLQIALSFSIFPLRLYICTFSFFLVVASFPQFFFYFCYLIVLLSFVSNPRRSRLVHLAPRTIAFETETNDAGCIGSCFIGKNGGTVADSRLCRFNDPFASSNFFVGNDTNRVKDSEKKGICSKYSRWRWILEY